MDAAALSALWARGRDPIVFATEILGLDLNPTQRRWFMVHTPTPEHGWPYHRTAFVSGNQVGKSVAVAIFNLWAASYKIGLDPSDPQRWLDTPFYGFHVAPDQSQAYIPLVDIELLVKGAHPAQARTGRPCHFPEGLVQFHEIDNHRGFSTLTGSSVQFRNTDQKAKALQGRRAHYISFDEAAFENHLKAVIDEALSMRLISTGGVLAMVSTPDGLNDWWEIVQGIQDRAQPHATEDRVWIGEDEALVWGHISDNVGFGISAEEAARKERELPEETKEQQLRGAFLEPREAFFVPSDQVLHAFKRDIHAEQPAVQGHRYVIFWDPSISSDPTAGYVVDTTKKPWRVTQEFHEAKPRGFTWLLNKMRDVHSLHQLPIRDELALGRSLNSVVTGYDATSMGGAIFKEALSSLKPSKALEFSGSPGKKLDILGNLRAALLKGELLIPDELVGLKREILNYRIDDKDIQQDRVMALAGAVHIAARYSGVQSTAFSPHGRSTSPSYRTAR